MPRDGSRLRPAAVAPSDEIPRPRKRAGIFIALRAPSSRPRPQSQSQPRFARRPSRAVRYAGVPA
ncbi:hypothetical protein C6Q09_17210 [Burkholderia multivorans]|nr:hypothetical protein BURMUCF2_A1293 [Burkholderia multivorans CF2]PRF68627.1 hypothetical protein C6Q09_17210 [Burkholderia multivorans]